LLKEEVGHAESLPKLWQNSLQWFPNQEWFVSIIYILVQYIESHSIIELTI
jgi:hypothetical protein